MAGSQPISRFGIFINIILELKSDVYRISTFHLSVLLLAYRTRSGVHGNAATITEWCYVNYSGWRRGSVVRTSVCSQWTFPDLRLIRGLRVINLWARRPRWVNQLGQLSLPSLRGRQMSSNLARSVALLSNDIALW